MRKQFYMLSLAIISLCMLAFSTTALAEEKDKSAPKKKSGKPAFAKKKIVTISGALGFDSDTNTPFDDKGKALDSLSSSTSTITVAPRIGYFVIKGLEIALDFGISKSTSYDSKDKEIGSSTSMLPTLDIAYYITQTKALKKQGFFPYVHMGLGYASQTNSAPSQKDIETSGYRLNPGLGLAWAVGYQQGGLLKLGFDYDMVTLNNDDKTGFDNAQLKLAVSFGIYL
jgi:hypothetical protein